MGDRELLAIKLEEWHHWLEGSKQPVVIWANHKKLTYLQSTKRLNPRQALWSLLTFPSHITPVLKKQKPEALFHLHAPQNSDEKPASILPTTCTFGSLHWEIEALITEALWNKPNPDSRPLNRTYVPSSVRS